MDPSRSSSGLFKSAVPTVALEPRKWYLQNYKNCPPPWISHSHFVPANMVTHLMRNKKDSALGVKFIRREHKPEQISNMEGALHTFVTPVADVTIHGDYQWKAGHSIHQFGSVNGYQLGRRVLLSALVQQDFEDEQVMLKVARLEDYEFTGIPNCPRVLDVATKQLNAKRQEYDHQLRRYLVYHLTASHRLPTRAAVRDIAMNLSQTLQFFSDAINHIPGDKFPAFMQKRIIRHGEYMISIEIIFMTAVHQIRNEFYLLERLCTKGYVYSFNPPAIFSQFFGSQGTELLSRIHAAALKLFAHISKMERCKCIAWDDYNSQTIFALVQQALKNRPHIAVKRKSDIFPKSNEVKLGQGLYVPPKEAKDAILVIHNNSDAFGQNIETEFSGGSLDGVIGAYSSAAASLMRHRKDLCSNLMEIPL